MKTIQTLPILLLFACGLSACHRDDATTVSPAVAAVTGNDYNYTTSMVYTLSCKAQTPVSLFQWNSGSINANQLTFSAIDRKGDVFYTTKFGNPITGTYSIFDPAMLGVVKLPTLTCGMAALTIGIAPSGTAHALVLNGMYKVIPDMPPTPITPIPVQIIIDEAVDINTTYSTQLTIDKPQYTASIQFCCDQATRGMTTTLMNAATTTNGAIVISNTSNQNLYAMVINNLRSNLMTVDIQAKVMATVTAAK